MKYQKSAKITLWTVRFFMLCLLALAITAPWITQYYVKYRNMKPVSQHSLLATFYACVPSVAYALWAMHLLLLRFIKGLVFTRGNVNLVRSVSLCCAIVAAVTLLGALDYLPFIIITALMAFLFLAVQVIANILEAATAMREENDLTI